MDVSTIIGGLVGVLTTLGVGGWIGAWLQDRRHRASKIEEREATHRNELREALTAAVEAHSRQIALAETIVALRGRIAEHDKHHTTAILQSVYGEQQRATLASVQVAAGQLRAALHQARTDFLSSRTDATAKWARLLTFDADAQRTLTVQMMMLSTFELPEPIESANLAPFIGEIRHQKTQLGVVIEKYTGALAPKQLGSGTSESNQPAAQVKQLPAPSQGQKQLPSGNATAKK